MRKELKKILSLFLSLIMCVSLIPAQNYVGKVMAAEGTVVILANVDISAGGYYLNDGKGGIVSEGASAENYNLYYDGNGQLILNGLDITKESYLDGMSMPGNCGIYSTTSLNISVIGENRIDLSSGYSRGQEYGIYTTSDVTILGEGFLYVHSGLSTANNAYGIYTEGSLRLETDIEVVGESSSSSSTHKGCGIYTASGITIEENGKLYVTAKGNRYCESISGGITLSSGTVVADIVGTGKCFAITPNFVEDYWWRGSNTGSYLANNYIDENTKYSEFTTVEPQEIALTYVTLQGNGGLIDGFTSRTILTNREGKITEKLLGSEPVYYNMSFDGWFLEMELVNKVDIYQTTFSEPVTLYAKWNPLEVTIGETDVTEGGYWLNDGIGGLTKEGADSSNFNVYYDGEGNLTLKEANVIGAYKQVSGYPASLHFRVAITVTLIGESVIQRTTGVGAYALKDVVFQGSGTLRCVEAETAKASGTRGFWFVYGLTIDEAQVYVDSTQTVYGVSANDLTVKNGGVLEAYGGEANTSSYHTAYGIYIEDTLNLSDGTVKGVGGDACYTSDHTYSYGVYANKIVVSGGVLEGTAGKVSRDEAWSSSPYYCSNGIYATTSIEVSGGEVKGVGNDVNSLNSYAWTYGISVGNGGIMSITGGKVIGQCGTATPSNTTLKRQYSLYNVTLSMTGGELILESPMSKAPSTLPEEYRWRTTETGEFTCSTDTAYKYSANNYLQIISENLVSEKTVTLYSITTDGMLSVTKVSGEGIYNVGNTVQIQADGLEEYIFTGWYVAEVDENNECIGYDADAKVSSDITYSFEITENVRYVAVYEKITSKVTGYTLSLNGDIAVNIHMTFTKEVLADDVASIKVTFTDGEFVANKISELDTRSVNGKVNYVFVCKVQAPEMNDLFVVELITESGSSQLDTYSVKGYGDYVFNHVDDNNEYAEAAPLVKAMLNYGGYSQKQFGHNTGALANADLYTESEDPVLVGTVPTLSVYAFTVPSKNVGVKYYGTSLLLNSETTIRHYFTFTEGEDIAEIRENYEFKLADGTLLTPVMRGGMIYIDIKDINAADLDEMYAVTVTNMTTSEEFTFSYSALSYAKYVLDYALAGTNLVNVIKAMCFYNEAANAYFG